MRHTVLLSASYMFPALGRYGPILEGRGIALLIADVQERLEEADLLRFAGKFDGAICGDDFFTARVLEACAPRLKVISKWGTGVDSIDAKACEKLGVRVCRTPNAFTTPVADTVLAYMLAFARNHPRLDARMKSGRWEKLPGISLSEATLGVIGMGNIGKAVAVRARAFGMRVLGNDIVQIDSDFLKKSGVQMVELGALLRESDFVSVNCDLNPTSKHLLNSQTLGQMKPSTVLINTARGPIVHELALIAALNAGQIAGAAMDVFEQEPLPADSPLRKMENVLLAPHNANASPQAWERVHRSTINNLLDGLGLPMLTETELAALDRGMK